MNEEIKQEITEEDIFRAWTGKSNEFYYKINNKNFNFCMLFFGLLYIFYRRMYLVGVIMWVINILISIFGYMFIGPIGTIIIEIIVSIIYGFAFYPLYRWNFKRKINKQKMYGATNEELLTYSKQKGGVSWTLVIISLVIPACIYLFVFITGVGLMVYNSANEETDGVNTNASTSNFSNTNISTNAEIILENNEYSINLDTTKWKNTTETSQFVLNSNVKQAFVYDNTNTNLFAYCGSEYVNKSFYDFTNYDDLKSCKDVLYNQMQQVCASSGIKLQGAYLFSKNNTYYIEVDMKTESSLSKIFIILEKQKNKILEFILATDNSYIDYSINNEILDTITNINVK